ncbi:putative immunoglobulin-blocking virulence protein [Mycoplasmopsis cynos]|uniref:Immunoglobulin-blocking virulence protein n=1 Tax=Mycoplasmopsis cynos (strain C142) TaxID=1246955 RepID=L0RUY9_MYCC1|nr:putative immunoglobulin-blocking virulence protein [Mycoplasmopsis cynos]WQQ18389.1 putative immunoglobulin-blocking virulence protein [Mycoplasmopsis cynos]CCP24369.1 Putative uncharacterized protein [Mycoplasmopsis cynos C142]
MIFKKRKARNLLLIFGVGSASSILASTIVYHSINDNTNSNRFSILNLSKPNFISKNNLDLSNLDPSITDINIKELEKVKPQEKPKPEINQAPIVLPKQEIEKEIKKEPTPAPKDPEIKKEEPAVVNPPVETIAEEPKDNSAIAIVDYGNVKVRIHVTPVPPRKDNPNDILKQIANRKPYISELAPDIQYVEVTEELKAQNRKFAQQALGKSILDGAFEAFRTPPIHWNEENFARYYESSPSNIYYFDKILEKFKNLLDNGDKVVEFLTDEGKKLYPELKKIKNEKIKRLRIISYIDITKFVLTSDKLEGELSQGYVIKPDNDNIYITEDGKLDSYSRTPLINGSVERLIKDNSELRTFDYNSYYGRTGKSVEEGTYPGWTKTDVTKNPEYAKYKIGDNDGIKFELIKRDVPDPKKRNQGIILTIDAENEAGYAKTLELINQLKADKKEITSYRIINIGRNNANQSFINIFKALPDKIPQLELFFETHNTTSLIALEDKEIDELSLYTTGNSNAGGWSINPWALKKTAWVNMIDYNVSFDYKPGLRVATRLGFDDIAFEDSDFDGKDFSRINNGLRMVYWVRNNERVFQGGLGAGLKPDRNEGENSYPVGLDLSRVTKIKSLRNLIFSDIEKPSNKPRKLVRLVLYNDSETFEIDADELNNANFGVIDTGPFSRSKISFRNGNQTRKIKITSKNGVTKLNSSGLDNLQKLITLARDNFGPETEFKVPNTDKELFEQLEKLGKKVIQVDPNEKAEFEFS